METHLLTILCEYFLKDLTYIIEEYAFDVHRMIKEGVLSFSDRTIISVMNKHNWKILQEKLVYDDRNTIHDTFIKKYIHNFDTEKLTHKKSISLDLLGFILRNELKVSWHKIYENMKKSPPEWFLERNRKFIDWNSLISYHVYYGLELSEKMILLGFIMENIKDITYHENFHENIEDLTSEKLLSKNFFRTLKPFLDDIATETIWEDFNINNKLRLKNARTYIEIVEGKKLKTLKETYEHFCGNDYLEESDHEEVSEDSGRDSSSSEEKKDSEDDSEDDGEEDDEEEDDEEYLKKNLKITTNNFIKLYNGGDDYLFNPKFSS